MLNSLKIPKYSQSFQNLAKSCGCIKTIKGPPRNQSIKASKPTPEFLGSFRFVLHMPQPFKIVKTFKIFLKLRIRLRIYPRIRALLGSLIPQSMYSAFRGSFPHRFGSLRSDIFIHFARNIYNYSLIKRCVDSFIQSLIRHYEFNGEMIRWGIYPLTRWFMETLTQLIIA